MIKSITYNTAGGIKCSLKNASRLDTIKMLLIGCSQQERDRVPALLQEVNDKAVK